MSSNIPKIIDKNRFTKKYPYVRAQKKLSFTSDSQIFVPIEDGYYVDGVLSTVPDGLWLGNEILTDLDVDFSWIDGKLEPVGNMIFGLRWSELEPGPGGQTQGYEGMLGQVAYSDGFGNVYASTTVTINEEDGFLSTAVDIIPTDDLSFDLGSETHRFANVYTGDLHLRNDRGHWQVVEEADCLTITNRLNGRKYKFVLEPLEEDVML